MGRVAGGTDAAMTRCDACHPDTAIAAGFKQSPPYVPATSPTKIVTVSQPKAAMMIPPIAKAAAPSAPASTDATAVPAAPAQTPRVDLTLPSLSPTPTPTPAKTVHQKRRSVSK
jgi:hypothetical protein